ncbi:FAD-containing monooxygenase EthA [Gammaproteobacteria bacterium 45_16_T64]|nr:FAD-containing monooxygenase EthA [Gammaproteobacteria bacterium 45_16_T64]
MSKEYLDVLIVGAGLSGVGAACHLAKACPTKSFAILEGRERMGGTWDLFRYPGIRSDSDMYTLGYNFKPWTNPKAIADGPSILSYIKETAKENNIDKHIRYGQKVKSANWSRKDALWTVLIEEQHTGKKKEITCNFFLSCAGYYSYESGFQPDFKGKNEFKGELIHPQAWPENFDYSDKKVVVIGSGATAVTIVPAMTDKAKHVTMLQRSPTYMMSLPEKDESLNKLREYLPEKWVYRFARTRNVALAIGTFQFSRRFPEKTKEFLLGQVKQQLGPNVDMKHFTPSYNPWDERLCAVTNGDLFKAIRNNKASIVTDHVKKFTETGIELQSGETLDADVIITATGLNVQMLGGIDIFVENKKFDITEKMLYKGVLIEDLPNLGLVFGYTNASWTLKSDLVSEFVCRLINKMDQVGMRQCIAQNYNAKVHHTSFLDMQSGYIQRAMDKVPQQGSRMPWKLYQNYAFDMAMLRLGKLDDRVVRFSSPGLNERLVTA